MSKSPDVFYYNVSIGNPANPPTAGFGVQAEISAKNNIPICENPDDYYCSIVRFEVPAFNIPLIQFFIQEPVTDISKGIYSFTIGNNTTYGSQTFVIYIPQILAPTYQIPQVGTPKQNFSTYYYFLYDYVWFISLLNTALASAVASYNTASGDTATAPFFNYDAPTQLITLYADKTYYDQSLANPVKIYFNNPLRNFMSGLPYIYTSLVSPPNLGLDDYIVIQDNHGLNETYIPPTATTGINYLKTSYQYSSFGYWSFLKSILVTTNMNVVSETFFVNKPTEFQNIDYINVLTDFLPDLSGIGSAGVGSQIFIYNAPSLYRIFEFKQKTPLYDVSLGVGFTDTAGNYYPLQLDLGQQCNFKLMFIKKEVYNTQNFKALKM